ncbi:hypothetical protein MMC25_007112 [Agyrium rufum]|nr:hypothetical protein [Agyrium rufum]
MEPTITAFFHLDGTTVRDRIVGVGGTGIVVERGGYAVKIPRISRDVEMDGESAMFTRLTPEIGDYDERPDHIRSMENERAVYERLGDHPGIIQCFHPSSTKHSIQMPLMQNGDLRKYMAEHIPTKQTKLCWFLEMARAIEHAHDRRVLIVDLRLENVLLDDELAVKLSDFQESTLMNPEWDLRGTDELGYSVLTDIGQFGAVMYEIVTRKHCKFDVLQNWKEFGDVATWPRRESLPSTDKIWLGNIIEKCWTQGFKSAKDLVGELEMESLE